MSQFKKGELSPNSKISDRQAALIKKQVGFLRKIESRYSTKALAKQYGISTSAVRRIASGQNWAHLK